jgi:hypothetical protein
MPPARRTLTGTPSRRHSGIGWGRAHYALPRHAEGLATTWSELAAARPAAPFDLDNLGSLLQLTSAITAWKQYGDSRWGAACASPPRATCIPTETWVIAYWVDGLADGLYHYQAREHSVEWRASALTASETPGLWLGFQFHPLARGLEVWRTRLALLPARHGPCPGRAGLWRCAVRLAAASVETGPRQRGALPRGSTVAKSSPTSSRRTPRSSSPCSPRPGQGPGASTPRRCRRSTGTNGAACPSRLDPNPLYDWPVIAEAAEATRGELALSSAPPRQGAGSGSAPPPGGNDAIRASEVILKRRSAQAFDGVASMPATVFRRLLSSLLAGGSPVWEMWAAVPRVHPVLFVHRVVGLAPGPLYPAPLRVRGRRPRRCHAR